MKKILTLCIVHQHPRVLLGMKKNGLGEGKWNGFGGKVEEGESVETAAAREVHEEAGIRVSGLQPAGVLIFEFENDPDQYEVHVFRTEKFEGEPVETEEMLPRWFEMSDVPFKDMWAADAHWFPLFMLRKRFSGKFLYDKQHRLISFTLEEKTTL